MLRMTGSRRAALVGMVAALLVTVGGGAALAVTDGNYQSSKQHCAGNANNSDHPDRVDPGCKSLMFSMADGNQHDFSWFGLQPTADGGGIQFDGLPGSIMPWLTAGSAGDVSYLLTHPTPLVDAGFGACADGICFNAQTQRRVAWQGDGKGSRNIANYEGKQWDPESC